ncbi:MFS transporter [Nocardia sp. NPDC005825]|uniref:MFS transporter n=1 Tax=unclassified Nocardia TaxID=2637762 RepID=UPI0033C1083B
MPTLLTSRNTARIGKAPHMRARRTMPPATTRVIWLLFAAWTVDYVDRLAINLALPDIGRDLGIGLAERGLIVSAFFLAYALAQIPGGALADRFGALRIVTAALVAWSLFTGLTALAFSLASMLVIRIAFGLAQGIFPAASLKLLSESTTPDQRMTANGRVQSANAAGALIAALASAIILPTLGWRALFLTVAVAGVFLAFVTKHLMPQPDFIESGDIESAGAPRMTVRQILSMKSMWMFTIAYFGYNLLIWGAQSWTPSYLNEQRGVSLGATSAWMALPTLASAAMTVLGGKLTDLRNGSPRLIAIPAMASAAVLAIVIPYCLHIGLLILCVTVFFGVAALAYMPIFSLAMRNLPTSILGFGSGMILTGGMVGGIVSPTLFGAIAEQFSWHVAFASLAAGPVITILAFLGAPATSERFRQTSPLREQSTAASGKASQ